MEERSEGEGRGADGGGIKRRADAAENHREQDGEIEHDDKRPRLSDADEMNVEEVDATAEQDQGASSSGAIEGGGDEGGGGIGEAAASTSISQALVRSTSSSASVTPLRRTIARIPPSASSASINVANGNGGGAAALAISPSPSSSQGKQLVVPRPFDREDDWTCPVCYDLLVRPVVTECGFTVCESCLAKSLEHADANRSSSALATIFQPAVCPLLGQGCRYGPVHRLPEVQSVLHNHLRDQFPEEYARRLDETSKEASMIQCVRERRHNDTTRNRRRTGGGGGGADYGGGGGGEGLIYNFVRQLRLQMEAFDGGNNEAFGRYPEPPRFFRRLSWLLCRFLPLTMAGVLMVCFQEKRLDSSIFSGGLADSIFAHAYLVSPMGYWDVGLLTSCPGLAPLYRYKLTKEAAQALLRPSSFIFSRILFPANRLLLAGASSDSYHQYIGLHYIICWSLTTLYMITYCMYHRIKRRWQEGMSILEIIPRELGLLIFICVVAESWSFIWYIFCRLAFWAAPCIFYHCWPPFDTIIGSIMRLLLEAVFLFAFLVGPSITTQELGIIGSPYQEGLQGNWENDLQALVTTRFSLIFMPRTILRMF